ncbi:MAG: hypothetical protein NC191_01340 [Muribaculaceae bacterium]|nr:hypothetical protein [Muribaculaceae bacterium]
MIAGISAACFAVPVLGPLMTLGFGALSLYEVGKGMYNAIKEYKHGNYDNSERAFEKIGTGVVGTVLTALGLKSSAKATVNMVETHKAGRPLSAFEQLKIKERIDNNGFLSALKDNLRLFSKDGFGAIVDSFNPQNIIARFKNTYSVIKNKSTVNPEELQRRANLSITEIEQEASQVLDSAFDKFGIPKDVRPKLEIIDDAEHINHCGHYVAKNHTITLNAAPYKKGLIVSLEDTIPHEALHAKMSIYRASLSDKEVQTAIKELLRDRIINGEPEQIIKEGSIIGNLMMEAPKMSPQMRQDFLRYADEFIFANGDSSEASTKLVQLLDRNPEFIAANGGTKDAALGVLNNYVTSHKNRLTAFPKIGRCNVTPIKLTPEQHKIAIDSLKEYVATIEGNSRTNGFLSDVLGVSEASFNQYQFSPEEILARNTAAEFEKSKLMTLLEDSSLPAAKRSEYLQRIQDLDFVFEYNQVGKEYYELYTKLLNNPQDAKLVKELKVLENRFREFELIKNSGNLVLKTSTTFPINAGPYFLHDNG